MQRFIVVRVNNSLYASADYRVILDITGHEVYEIIEYGVIVAKDERDARMYCKDFHYVYEYGAKYHLN